MRDVNSTFSVEAVRANQPDRPPVAGTRSVPATGCPVPAVWLQTDDYAEGSGGGTILYVHGGAFVAGSIRSYSALASKIALATRARVLLIEYRLAPEHTFPAPLDDTLAAFRWLLQPEQGCTPARVALMGDSAGGNIILGAALQLARAHEALPGFLGLLSPAVDLSDSIAVVDRGTDYLVTKRKGYNARLLYAGSEEALLNTLVSPLLADDLHVLAPCPMLIESGAVELHQPRIAAFAAKAKAAGCNVELNEYTDMPHVFQSLASIFPEAAARSLATIGAYAKAHFPSSA
jgi:acetyl esterase/lipase